MCSIVVESFFSSADCLVVLRRVRFFFHKAYGNLAEHRRVDVFIRKACNILQDSIISSRKRVEALYCFGVPIYLRNAGGNLTELRRVRFDFYKACSRLVEHRSVVFFPSAERVASTESPFSLNQNV